MPLVTSADMDSTVRTACSSAIVRMPIVVHTPAWPTHHERRRKSTTLGCGVKVGGVNGLLFRY